MPLERERREAAKLGNLFRKSKSSTNREMGKEEIGLKTYLVVGYVPRIMKDEYIKKSESTKQKPGQSQRPEIVISSNDKKPALLAVVESTETQPDTMQLAVLLKPRGGVCTPYQVGVGYVFCQHEHRDNTTAIKARGPN